MESGATVEVSLLSGSCEVVVVAILIVVVSLGLGVVGLGLAVVGLSMAVVGLGLVAGRVGYVGLVLFGVGFNSDSAFM